MSDRGGIIETTETWRGGKGQEICRKEDQKRDDGTLVEPTPRIKKGKKPKAALKKKILLELSSDSAEDNCPVVDSDDLSTGDCEDEDVVPIEVGSYY